MEDVSDLGVGQAREIVVGDGLALFGRQRADGGVQIKIAMIDALPAGRVMSMALRCAIVTSHASTLASAGS
ncbi:hypothetical protein MSG_02787 [Mycobacterium shigaense]|uniref:Uncharacterized protein n=1 Tax=Mycobacterium shigaense TaxID=722731 RepID=A0A1Z4EJ04_9MYCO|nr:hypothetical protein MSG_02787 [Mycobacterium shigaense]